MLIIDAIGGIWTEVHAAAANAIGDVEARLLPTLRTLEGQATCDLTEVTSQLLQALDAYPEIASRLHRAIRDLHDLDVNDQDNDLLGGLKRSLHVDLPILFITDRQRTESDNPQRRFTGRRQTDATLNFGYGLISIPDEHRLGTIEKPKWSRLSFRRNRARHVALLRVVELDETSFLEALIDELASSNEMDVLIFIHGYNVSFAEASRRAGQLCFDTGFAGPVILYSWPSEGTTLRYAVDENNAEWSIPHFQEILRLLSGIVEVRSINVVAHSMGGRVLARGLGSAPSKTTHEPHAHNNKLGHIVFAAPDVDLDVFRGLVKNFSTSAKRVTLYASSNDKALMVSRSIAGYPRAGQSGDCLMVEAGVDTLDASQVDTGLMGHSYFGDRSSILSDLFYLLNHSLPPESRFGLTMIPQDAWRYWRIDPRKP